MKKYKILIVEDDKDMGDNCHKLFRRSGYQSAVTYSGKKALEIISKDGEIGIVLSDLKMPGMDGIELLKEIKSREPHIDVIIMTGFGTIHNAVQAIKIGATDYITKPFDKDELLNAVGRIIEAKKLKAEVSLLRHELQDKYGSENIIAKSKKMREVLKQVSFAARSDSPVLILGESGTGKELIAKAIHYGSERAKGPFVPVNCGALPKDLIESELFGHKKGAYTGADRENLGLFRSADKGTILLDEIAEMPRETQVKLLRVLQEKRIRPVGYPREIPIDVRIVSATNRNLKEALAEGFLRKDLYFRISVLVIQIPPLRERVEDIPFLADHFVHRFGKAFNRQIGVIERDAVHILKKYDWPGNVRELKNLIEGLFVMGIDRRIAAPDVEEILGKVGQELAVDSELSQEVGTLSSLEQMAIEKALIAAKGNKSKAAAILGISRTRLYKKLELHKLE